MQRVLPRSNGARGRLVAGDVAGLHTRCAPFGVADHHRRRHRSMAETPSRTPNQYHEAAPSKSDWPNEHLRDAPKMVEGPRWVDGSCEIAAAGTRRVHARGMGRRHAPPRMRPHATARGSGPWRRAVAAALTPSSPPRGLGVEDWPWWPWGCAARRAAIPPRRRTGSRRRTRRAAAPRAAHCSRRYSRAAAPRR